MKKNAFTLIELLAVIVILAIIALIAVPIVIHIINDTKTSSEEQSVELYMDSVKKAIARKQLEDSSFNPRECIIQENGNLLCDDIEVIVDMKGIKPNKGIIEIKNNQVTYKNLLLNGTYYNRLATPVQDNNNNKKPDIGDQYTYKVNDEDTFNFYVLSFNEDDNTVNLIMDRNICNDGTVEYKSSNNYCRYNWYSLANNNTYGPVTAMQALYKGTKDWDNVPNMIMNYKDEYNVDNSTYGYTGITTSNGVTIITGKPESNTTTVGTSEKPLKARLPQESELKIGGCTTSNGSCPVWLIENMKYYNVNNDKYAVNNNSEANQNFLGYWLLPSRQDKMSNAYSIYYFGCIRNYNLTPDNKTGIRPVITVPKSYLES